MPRRILFVLAAAGLCAATAQAQESSDDQLKRLAALVERQSQKIDVLTAEVAKLRGKLDGPAPAEERAITTAPRAEAAAAHAASSGPTHTVAKGETLTSIAKLYKVTVADLKTANKIENERALQIGQTLAIPVAPSESPTH